MKIEQIQQKIGERIRIIREEQHIAQQDLAAACNFEKANMSRIESGRTNFTISTLYKISKNLNTTLSDLVNVEQE